ncbi:MFS general substrate transporter [Ganoderma sinense ZZ0214-1]|uniref:MFS general substrate transporter n=1 Tax=Ganoderma sinense ZZ0214-1 TaxID=1077348 RepID=A0A2G8RNJ9_9APHY|nr:MFS general substrate transporter [Ganoderma sinense ZZ0214-1]
MSSFTTPGKLVAGSRSMSIGGPAQSVDPKRVLWKLDSRLLPVACTLYFLCSLDRTNIGTTVYSNPFGPADGDVAIAVTGNAKIAGLVADLHLTGVQFNLCVAILLIPYSLLDVPALKKIGPSRWLPLSMVLWGCIMVSMSFVKNFGGIMTARVFLGAAEAGILPGLTYYLSAWYPKASLAKRIGILYAGSTLASAFGGLLAFAIEKMNGIGRLAGWSWIFLLEGLLTVLVATLLHFCMHDYPENAAFLSKAERDWLLDTIRGDTVGLSRHFKREFVIQALRDPQAYIHAVIFFFTALPALSFPIFLPTIINGLGFSSTNAQLLSIAPNATGCVFTLAVCYLSDRLRARGPFILAGSAVAIVGYAIVLGTKTPAAQYAGTIVVGAGLLPSVACQLAWMGGMFGGEVKRAVAIALIVGCGNLGGVVASFIYRQQDSPRLHLINRSKIAQCEREGITAEKSDAFEELGDGSPLYRYTL